MEPLMIMGGEAGRDIKVWRTLYGKTEEVKMNDDIKEAFNSSGSTVLGIVT